MSLECIVVVPLLSTYKLRETFTVATILKLKVIQAQIMHKVSLTRLFQWCELYLLVFQWRGHLHHNKTSSQLFPATPARLVRNSERKTLVPKILCKAEFHIVIVHNGCQTIQVEILGKRTWPSSTFHAQKQNISYMLQFTCVLCNHFGTPGTTDRITWKGQV